MQTRPQFILSSEFWGNGVRTHVNSKVKIPSTEKKFSPKEDRTSDAASSRTASPTHYQRAIPAHMISEFLASCECQPFCIRFSSVFPTSYIYDPVESSLSPSPLLFVSHCPTACQFMLPNSSLSLLVTRNACVLLQGQSMNRYWSSLQCCLPRGERARRTIRHIGYA